METNAEKVRKLYEKKAAEGLLDVKFTLTAAGRYESSTEEVFGEILAMQEAIDAGRFKPLDFGDLHWRD